MDKFINHKEKSISKTFSIYLKAIFIILIIFPQFSIFSNKLFCYTSSSIPPPLKMEYGSRALSMGGASVALINNIFYIDSNPAGGLFGKVYRVSILHQEWIYDTNYESLRFSIGTDNFYLGGGFNYLYTPFKYYDYFGVTTGKNYDISQFLGLANFGFKIDRLNMVIGSNIKYFYYSVPDSLYKNQSYSLFAVDIGAMIKTNIWKRYIGYLPSMVFGLNIKNIGYSNYLYHAPLEIISGISYRYNKSLLFSFELGVPIFEPLFFSAGVEYSINRVYFIDAGFKLKKNPMFGFGFGYRKKDFRVRVSYSPMLRFYNMFNISVSYSYGETREEVIREKVEKLLVKAIEYFTEGKYEKSLETIAEALDIAPHNYRAKRLYKLVLRQLEIKEKLKEIEKKVNG